jgi:hypothetical protein
MTIQSNKELFEVVKYFKSIYTTINFNNKDRVYLKGFNDHAKVYYDTESHYLLHGKLFNDGNNEFLNWMNGKNIMLELNDVKAFRECLKKNVVELTTTETEFRFEYLNKEEKTEFFVCSTANINNPYESVVDKIQSIDTMLSNTFDVDGSYFTNEITKLYQDGDNGITNSRNENKIFEFPSKRLMSLQKDADKHQIRLSDIDDDEKRYIEITSSNSYISLSQIFAII